MSLPRRKRARLERLLVEARWRRYARDPSAFMRECVWVPAQNDPRGRVPFDLYDYQEDTLEQLRTERFNVVLKARQLGLTTELMAYALWLLFFRPGSNIVLVSKSQDAANKALSEQLDFMLQFLPDWVKWRGPELKVDAAREHVWEFPDGLRSRIVSLPPTKTAGAGETATLVIWDEAALPDDAEDLFRTLMPTTDAGGSMVVFSTARGAHNRFARIYREAEALRSMFKPLFHPWFVSRLINPKAHLVRGCGTCAGSGRRAGDWCPTCVDATVYELKRREFADEPWRFYAEYPSSPEEAFRQSGRSRFSSLLPIDDYEAFPHRGRLEWDGRGGIRFVEDEEGPLRLRGEALTGAPSWASSTVSLDPAGLSSGQGDYSAMTAGWIDDAGIPQRMAFWHARDLEPLEVARQADLLGRWFAGADRAALLVIEKSGGYADTALTALSGDLAYPNLYVHRYTGHRKRRAETTFGMPMTPSRRPLVIDRLAEWVIHDEVHDLMGGIDPLLRHELGAFVVKENGKVEADVGMHDDLVMSTAVWIWVLTEVVGTATAGSRGEEPASSVGRHDLSEMFAAIETARAAQEREAAKFQRQLARGARRGHGW